MKGSAPAMISDSAPGSQKWGCTSWLMKPDRPQASSLFNFCYDRNEQPVQLFFSRLAPFCPFLISAHFDSLKTMASVAISSSSVFIYCLRRLITLMHLMPVAQPAPQQQRGYSTRHKCPSQRANALSQSGHQLMLVSADMTH